MYYYHSWNFFYFFLKTCLSYLCKYLIFFLGLVFLIYVNILFFIYIIYICMVIQICNNWAWAWAWAGAGAFDPASSNHPIKWHPVYPFGDHLVGDRLSLAFDHFRDASNIVGRRRFFLCYVEINFFFPLGGWIVDENDFLCEIREGRRERRGSSTVLYNRPGQASSLAGWRLY